MACCHTTTPAKHMHTVFLHSIALTYGTLHYNTPSTLEFHTGALPTPPIQCILNVWCARLVFSKGIRAHSSLGLAGFYVDTRTYADMYLTPIAIMELFIPTYMYITHTIFWSPVGFEVWVSLGVMD